VAEKSGIELGDSSLQTRRYLRMSLAVALQMGVADAGRGVGIVGFGGRGKEIADIDAAIGRLGRDAVVVDAAGQEELLDQHGEAGLVGEFVPQRAMGRVADELEGGLSVVADEVDVVRAEDTAVVLSEPGGAARGGPLPLDGKLEVVTIEEGFDLARAAPFMLERVSLRALRKDRRGGELRRQRFPEKDIGVDMSEGAVLQTVGGQLAQRPPAGRGVAQPIQFGRDAVEFQAQRIDEHPLAGGVGDQQGFRKVLPGQTKRESPRQQVMRGFPPDSTFAGLEGLAPE